MQSQLSYAPWWWSWSFWITVLQRCWVTMNQFQPCQQCSLGSSCMRTQRNFFAGRSQLEALGCSWFPSGIKHCITKSLLEAMATDTELAADTGRLEALELLAGTRGIMGCDSQLIQPCINSIAHWELLVEELIWILQYYPLFIVLALDMPKFSMNAYKTKTLD